MKKLYYNLAHMTVDDLIGAKDASGTRQEPVWLAYVRKTGHAVGRVTFMEYNACEIDVAGHVVGLEEHGRTEGVRLPKGWTVAVRR